jgi:ADP-ribose pyrophosphatase YjhB (NUDIX family)
VTAVAVVAEQVGVLAGRRRDGDPPWVLPAATVGAGETPAQAAARACKQQTVWVPETLLTSCHLLILVDQSTEPIRRRTVLAVACRARRALGEWM